MCHANSETNETLPGDFLMPGHPFWDTVRPSEELSARVWISPALRSGDPDDPVVEIVYLLTGVARAGGAPALREGKPSVPGKGKG